MTNILIAFANLVRADRAEVFDNFGESHNRANQMGEGFETYIKDLFCNSSSRNAQEKWEIYQQNFSYLGNQNNPPDLIIRDGDAVEMKKIESSSSALALNSSHPKNKLFLNDPRINSACRECEDWFKKDIVYAVGSVKSGELYNLWLIYGDCYAACREIYESLSDRISRNVLSTPDVEFTETNEIAKINRVDPLGITYLRIRGMWGIEHPSRVFDYISETHDKFANLILRRDKYFSFPKNDRNDIENLRSENFMIFDIWIKNPDNPVQLISAKLLSLRGKNE